MAQAAKAERRSLTPEEAHVLHIAHWDLIERVMGERDPWRQVARNPGRFTLSNDRVEFSWKRKVIMDRIPHKKIAPLISFARIIVRDHLAP